VTLIVQWLVIIIIVVLLFISFRIDFRDINEVVNLVFKLSPFSKCNLFLFG